MLEAFSRLLHPTFDALNLGFEGEFQWISFPLLQEPAPILPLFVEIIQLVVSRTRKTSGNEEERLE